MLKSMDYKIRRILIIRAYAPFVSEAPSEIRISNFIEAWLKKGCEITLCQYKTKHISEYIGRKLFGAKLDFIELSARKMYWLMIADRLLSILCPWGIGSILHDYIMMKRLKTYTSGDFDLILTSVPQFSGLILASKLSKRLRIPWVADFRDLPDEFDPERKNIKIRILTEVVERYLRTASLAVTVSPPLVDSIYNRYKFKNVNEKN